MVPEVERALVRSTGGEWDIARLTLKRHDATMYWVKVLEARGQRRCASRSVRPLFLSSPFRGPV